MKYRDPRIIGYSTVLAHRAERMKRIIQMELECFMKNQDESYLQWVLYNPSSAAQISGFLSYAHPNMHTAMFTQRFNGQEWKITFTTGHKAPGLRVATLVHPRLKVEVREQNPMRSSIMAAEKRNGAEVYQIYVDGQPARYIWNAEFWDIPESEDRDLRQTS